MNKDQLQGKWRQIKGDAKKKWGELTDDDLTEIDGNQEKLVGKLQEKYGLAKADAEKQADEWRSSI